MHLAFETTKATLTAKISGELDHHVAKKIRENIDLKLATGVYNILIFDFTDLQFMDSSGIAVIMGRVKNMNAVSGKVKIKTQDEKIMKILQMSGISNYAEFI